MSLVERILNKPSKAYFDENHVVHPVSDHDIKTPEGLKDFMCYAIWFEKADRRVASTIICKRRHIYVSTVFLGWNHGWGERDLWFETMIFGTSLNDYQMRYETWEQAERGHKEAVRRARQARWIKYEPFNLKRRRRAFRRINKYVKRVKRDV